MTAIKRRRAAEGYQRPRVGHWGGCGYRRAAWRLDPFRILTVVWTQSGPMISSYFLATEAGPGMALGLELRPVREAGIRL